MGKRKMHERTYYQCDWTGIPMRQTNCYMPHWSDDGKLFKHGSYTCWEAVKAHAFDLYSASDEAKFKRINAYIDGVVGCAVKQAPPWTQLTWFAKDEDKDTLSSAEQFMQKVDVAEEPVAVVKLPATLCEPQQLYVMPDSSQQCGYDFAECLNAGALGSFKTTRKEIARDREVTVFHYVAVDQPLNVMATNIFKMQLYGDVILTQNTKELCFAPRNRYVDYNLSDFHDQFIAKSKRKEMSSTPSAQEFATTKEQMAQELQQAEQLASSSALEPADLAKASVLPPPSGRELADLLKAKGQFPRSAPKIVRTMSLPVEAQA